MMAGHWTGIINDDGRPYNGDFNAINNYAEPVIAETVEQMYGMIWWLADLMAQDNYSGESPRKLRLALVKNAYLNYEAGVRLGAGEEKSPELKAKFDKAVETIMSIGWSRNGAQLVAEHLIQEGVIELWSRLRSSQPSTSQRCPSLSSTTTDTS
jgi:hypothetical protein